MRVMLPLSLAAVLLSSAAWAQQCQPGPIPDQSPWCTPGMVASYDQADVCSHVGGTYSRRHRLSQNPETKREVLSRYGVSMSDARLYEDDHDIPLCLGGSDSVQNRWPQPRNGVWTSAQKDELEAFACREVCEGHVSLGRAQAWFLAPADWRQAYALMKAGKLP